MKEKDNVGKYNECYGCGVCESICPTNIINVKLNENGFLTPAILDNDKCINCGLCLKVCSYNKPELSNNNKPTASFGGWNNDINWRTASSSGGIAVELLREAINQNYFVCAVEYQPDKNIAQHFITQNKDDLFKTIGSKYIQSHTQPAFKSFENKKKYVVIGTPCQIDSLRRYSSLKKMSENFIFIDFFCHGTPSYLAWAKYLKIVTSKIGKISFINWRNKLTGWHDSWAIGANSHKDIKNYSNGLKFQYFSRLSKGDVFFNLFLGDFCMNPACCNSCKYKYDKSAADIRLGDFWGETYKKDEKGVSAIVSFTPLGNKFIKYISDKCVLKEYPFVQVAEGQMKRNAKPSVFTWVVMNNLKSDKDLKLPILKALFFCRLCYYLPERIIAKIKQLVS